MRRNPNSYRQIDLVPRRTIRITGHDTSLEYSAFGSYDPYDNTCKYSWRSWHVDKDNCGEGEDISDFEGFADDTPAIEINGRTDVEEDTIVEAWLAPDGDHWLFNGSTLFPGGPGSGSGGCCFGAPTGIYAFSGQVCCNSTNGFHASTFYMVWDPQDCVPYIFTEREDALDFVNGYTPPLDSTFYGECP